PSAFKIPSRPLAFSKVSSRGKTKPAPATNHLNDGGDTWPCIAITAAARHRMERMAPFFISSRSAAFQTRLFPSLHHRKEGCLRHQKNVAKPPKPDADGVVLLRQRSENHPVLALIGGF